MLPDSRLSGAVVVLAVLLAAPGAGAGPVRLVASDDRGVTLRLEVAPFTLGPPREDGRTELVVPGLYLLDTQGRPKLPYATALIALPPGASAVASVVDDSGEETRDGLVLTLGERPVFHSDPGGLGPIPAREPVAPIRDGAWPRAAVEVGEPFTVRRQRMVPIQLQPFRYDDATGRLWARRSLTVRVSFTGGTALRARPAAAPEDRHWEPVLRGTVINYEQGRRWREPRPALAARGLFDRSLFDRAAPTGAQAAPGFDELEPEVRVRIDSTGVWALDADLLLGLGYPAGVPIAEVSVHRHEPIPNVLAPNPPYVTIELPGEVDDLDGDGTFSSGDRIVVFVQNWWERSGLAFRPSISHAQRGWGESEVIYATRVRPPRTGLRVAPRPGWNNSAAPVLASYPWTQRYERNSIYLNSPIDTLTDVWHWTTLALYYSRPETLRFEANHLDNTKPASIAVTWVGRLSTEEHFMWAAVRNLNGAGPLTTVVDSARFFGKNTMTRGATIPGTALSEGLTNRLAQWGKSHGFPPSPGSNDRTNAGLNYYDVTYWRSYRALGGYLACNSGTTFGDYEILAVGFADSSQLRVYDVTDSSDVRRLTGVRFESAGGGVGVRFQDNAAPGQRRRYVAFDTPRSRPASSYSAVNRAEITNLYDRPGGDYLLVVPRAFLGAIAPLEALRRSQGLDVVVAPLEAVNDAFNGGRRSPYAIRRFIRYAFDNWDARFVLLVGDGSEDPLDFGGRSSIDWVPTQRVLGPVPVSIPSETFYESVVSDPWYVWCVDCPDLSVASKLPDLFIGRLPVNSLSEASAVVSKLVAYENVTPDQTWRRDMVLLADDQFSGENFFGGGSQIGYCRRSGEDVFHDLNVECRSIILDEAGLRQSNAEVFDLSYYLPTRPEDICVPCLPETCRADRTAFQTRGQLIAKPALMQRLNAGRLWWNYQGHANETVLAHEDLYLNRPSQDDRLDFLNDGRLFLFTAFSCHANAFGHTQERGSRGGPSLGEDMVTLPGRGAIASWASTGYELLPSSHTVHLNTAFARALFADPPRDSSAWEPRRGARVVLGEVIAKAELDYFPGPRNSPFERDVMVTYNLLGDPATRMTIGAPEAVVTANGQPVTSGQVVRLKVPGDTLQLEADLVSNARIDSLSLSRTSSAGVTAVVPPASYTVTPAFPDTADPAGEGRRYRLKYRDPLIADSFRYTFRTVDRYDVPSLFEVVFAFQTVLRADGVVLRDGDAISPGAAMALTVLSPAPLVPAADLTLRVIGQSQLFSAAPANGDTSAHEWVLSWNHAPFPVGKVVIELAANGGATQIHRFRVAVTGGEVRLENALAFPNPFNDDSGTHFSFNLVSATPADVLIRVYAVSGRLIYERAERGLQPGYHQLPWNAHDAEVMPIANGVYLYRLIAHNGSSTALHEGRLVKLRKPRHLADDTAP